jgi:hypothetical protein
MNHVDETYVLNTKRMGLQMDNSYNNLTRLIDELKAISFWQRLFGWKRITNLLVDAATDIQNLASNNAHLANTNNEQRINNAAIKEELRNTAERKNQLEIELEGLKANFSNLQREHAALKQTHTQLTTEEETRRNKYNTDVALLNSLTTQIQAERAAEQNAKNSAAIESLKALKETWNRHEESVKSAIRIICNKHVIEYVDKVSFKGEPDNTLKICDEFVVFDAKSPGGDDLTNFPTYLKDQAEKAKKYAKQEGVKKDVFFVVPTNTLSTLKQFVFNLGDYDVFIISADSLEQIILSLKKIEEYEFAEKLSPEERDNICRLLGKFAHLTKTPHPDRQLLRQAIHRARLPLRSRTTTRILKQSNRVRALRKTQPTPGKTRQSHKHKRTG